MRRAVLSVVCVVCASCATSRAKPRGEQVVQTSSPPASCEVVGPVKGSDTSIEVGKPWEHLQVAPSRKAAVADALDEAGEKGATHAHLGELQPQPAGFYVEGMAYDCSRAPPPPPPAAEAAAPGAPPPAWLGCQKDTECKGERICRNRECVDP